MRSGVFHHSRSLALPQHHVSRELGVQQVASMGATVSPEICAPSVFGLSDFSIYVAINSAVLYYASVKMKMYNPVHRDVMKPRAISALKSSVKAFLRPVNVHRGRQCSFPSTLRFPVPRKKHSVPAWSLSGLSISQLAGQAHGPDLMPTAKGPQPHRKCWETWLFYRRATAKECV